MRKGSLGLLGTYPLIPFFLVPVVMPCHSHMNNMIIIRLRLKIESIYSKLSLQVYPWDRRRYAYNENLLISREQLGVSCGIGTGYYVYIENLLISSIPVPIVVSYPTYNPIYPGSRPILVE